MSESGESPPGPTRRTFVKRGALASGCLALGTSGAGVAAGQDPGGKALMFNDEYRPGARFRVVSPVLDETPDVPAVEEQDVWADTNTRAIEYLNTNERVLFFPVEDASVEQGRVYQFSPRDMSVFQDDEGIVSVGFELPPDRGGNGADDGYEVIDGGGQALLAVNNFYPGAILRIVSGVVEWSPREDVRGSDVFADYNTRFAEYGNSSDEFLFYPAHSAAVERGAVYVMRDEFDATEPEGRLVTVTFDRVDETTLETPTGTVDRANETRRTTERTPDTTGTPKTTETATGGQPGFGPLLAGLGVGGGLLARAIARRREA